VRQGFRWWEIDVSFYVLRLLAVVGLVHDLNPVPARARAHERRLRG
jgi:stearoyl-CoA desaturase (delta-9 desaturase)